MSTERVGVNNVEALVLHHDHIFRDQPVSDFGIDAHMEIKDSSGDPTGRLIAFQIKTGKSYLTTKTDTGFVFYGEDRHLNYWRGHSLPVFLILCDPCSKAAHWQLIDNDTNVENTKSGWKVEVPFDHRLDTDEGWNDFFNAAFVASRGSANRWLFTLFRDLNHAIDENGEVYFQIDEWGNKSLNIRGFDAYLSLDDVDSGNKPADFQFDYMIPTNGIHGLFEQILPWLDYDYVYHIDEHAGEVWSHVLRVTLNELGQSLMMAEKYFESDDWDYTHTPEYPEIDPRWDDDEVAEYEHRKALEADWEAEGQLNFIEAEKSNGKK